MSPERFRGGGVQASKTDYAMGFTLLAPECLAVDSGVCGSDMQLRNITVAAFLKALDN